MKIVLDTNIIFRTQRRLLHGVEIEVLRRAQLKTPLTIVVPSVVKQELIGLFGRDFRKERDLFLQQATRLQGILPKETIHARCEIDEADAVAGYEELLTNRLSELAIECPGYEHIPHNAIIERCLESRKPFKANGSGYRDALIWETVLREVAGTDHLTLLVTDNSQDFADPKDRNKLHQDLIEDLECRGLAADSVLLCSSLEEFSKRYVLPELELLDDIARRIKSGESMPLNLQSFMMDNYECAIRRAQERTLLDDNVMSRLLGESVVGARIVEIDLNTSEEGELDVRRLDASSLVLDLPATHFSEIEFLVDRDAAQQLLQKQLIVVDDFAWCDCLVHAHAICEVAFSLQIILDAKCLSCVAWDLSQVVIRRVWSQDELSGI